MRAQIIATIGPASNTREVFSQMLDAGMDVARINFAWFDEKNDEARIAMIEEARKAAGRALPIIADVPGPRLQQGATHTYDRAQSPGIPEKDMAALRFCEERNIEYAALSFVGAAEDVERYRAVTGMKLIAKIERKAAVEALDGIIAAADAVMVARGDLGKEVPIEEIPFIQSSIIAKANAAEKPVIVATELMASMVAHPEPTRAEVTDVEEAVREGADAVMLSEETASGKFPVEAVAMMKRAILAAERHYGSHPLHRL